MIERPPSQLKTLVNDESEATVEHAAIKHV